LGGLSNTMLLKNLVN